MPRASLVVAVMSLGLSAHASFTPAISFFRNPQSLFPSGQSSFDDLNKEKRGELLITRYEVKKDGREFDVSTTQVLRDLDLSAKAVDIKNNVTGWLIKAESPWYQFMDETGHKSWKRAEELVPAPDDVGLAVSYAFQPLRKFPEWKSEAWKDVRPGARFRVLGFRPGFVQVSPVDEPELIGYLDVQQLILKTDFAAFVLARGGTWRGFVSRERENLKLTGMSGAELNEVQGLITRPELGILIEALPERGLVPRSTVEIRKTEWTKWVKSELKGHGVVFWKKSPDPARTQLALETFTTDEILARPLFSVAIHPTQPQLALISADGIFETHDGKLWRRITTFGKANHPVAISERGEYFVGSQRSTDGGQSFSPFLRWQDLTSLLEARHRRTPGTLKLTDVQAAGPEKVLITLDTGLWKAWLVGSTKFGLVTEWRVLKEN